MPRGGKREGAGRKGNNKPNTKATIYLEDRQILNEYAKSLNLPVNEFLHRVINDEHFSSFIQELGIKE
jgi:hypothetical protein